MHTLEGHTYPVTSVAFSPCGRFIASGSADKTVKVWDLETVQIFQTLEGHTLLVTSVAFSPDGRFIASGSVDKNLVVWMRNNEPPQHYDTVTPYSVYWIASRALNVFGILFEDAEISNRNRELLLFKRNNF